MALKTFAHSPTQPRRTTISENDTTTTKTRPHVMPEGALRKIETWLEAAEKHARTRHYNDSPPHDMLLMAAMEWPARGIVEAPMYLSDEDGAFIRLTLEKPKQEGTTERDLDPELFALLLCLMLPGGRIAIDAKGEDGQFYYLRVYVDGERKDAQPGRDRKRRVNILRIAADTPTGPLTVEPPENFRSLRRKDLGKFRKNKPTEPRGLYGTERAKRDALNRFREIAERTPEALPPGLDEARYVALLERAHQLLMAVPLGELAEADAL